MAFGYRVYQLFRTFWVQNVLACLVGGTVGMGLFGIIKICFLLYPILSHTTETFYVQIIPKDESSVALTQLLGTLRSQFPRLQFDIRRDEAIAHTIVSTLQLTRADAVAMGITPPTAYIAARFRDSIPKHIDSYVADLKKCSNVSAVDAELGLLSHLAYAKEIVTIIGGTCVVGLLIFLFYLLQFVLSQLVVERRQEILLEYLLGATEAYQKRPYQAYILFFLAVSVCFALIGWFAAGEAIFRPFLNHFHEIAHNHIFSLTIYEPWALIAFVGGYGVLVWSLFHGIWRFHTRKIIHGEWDRN